MSKRYFRFLSIALCFSTSIIGSAASNYPTRLNDPAAVYLTPADFPVHADGQQDDTEAVQAAVDKVQATRGEGIVFIRCVKSASLGCVTDE